MILEILRTRLRTRRVAEFYARLRARNQRILFATETYRRYPDHLYDFLVEHHVRALEINGAAGGPWHAVLRGMNGEVVFSSHLYKRYPYHLPRALDQIWSMGLEVKDRT